MLPEYKRLSATQLIQCLAGELLTDPGLLLETIKDDQDLMRVCRSYFAGDLTYSHVLETVSDYV